MANFALANGEANVQKATDAITMGYPDPIKYPQDAADYNKVWTNLMNIPDEQLKVQFQDGQ